MWVRLHEDARKNYPNWTLEQKKQYHTKTSLPTMEKHHVVYKGHDLGLLPVRVGGDGNGNGSYRTVILPDGSSMNLDVSVRPEFQKCWKCKKEYNAWKSNGSCPHCGIDI